MRKEAGGVTVVRLVLPVADGKGDSVVCVELDLSPNMTPKDSILLLHEGQGLLHSHRYRR